MKQETTEARTIQRVAQRPRDVVYRFLKRQILLNDLPPNAPLTELGVAQDMGCSQGTVREALLLLQEDGLVLRSGHRGTAVTPLDAETAAAMLALRRQIETQAAPRMVVRSTPDIARRLAEIIDEMMGHAEAGDEFGLIEADIAFHMTMFRLAGYQAMEPILNRVMLHTHRQKLWEPRHRRSLRETAARHQALVAALARDGAALADALGEHIDTIVDVTSPELAAPRPRARTLI